MGYVYATINKDTLAHICKEKGVSSEFLASKTKLNMSRLNQWLTPTDINLPTINQAKKIAACLHIPFAGLYMNPCNGVQREHNKKLNNGLPILHKVPPKRDYGRYFCIMAEKGGTSHGGLTEKLSLFFHAKKQEVNAYGR